jgi:hypothetical protein
MSRIITFWPSESCTKEQSDAVMASVNALPGVETVTCEKWPTNPAAVMGLYVIFLRDDANEPDMRQIISDLPGIGWMLNADEDPE